MGPINLYCLIPPRSLTFLNIWGALYFLVYSQVASSYGMEGII